jgi:hypothetical protein
VLLRLPYLALTSVFAFIRLLPMSDTDKDIEILTLRHQLARRRRDDRSRDGPAMARGPARGSNHSASRRKPES